MYTKQTAIRNDFLNFCYQQDIAYETDKEIFRQNLFDTFGDTADQYFKYSSLMAKGDVKDEPYDLVYSSLDFNNAIVGQLDIHRLSQFSEWLLKHYDPSKKIIVDVGCGNGLLSCFLAQRFPDAQIYAIDINEKAIFITESRANKLGLTNINAHTACLKDFLALGFANKIDLIIATQIWARHEFDVDICVSGIVSPDERDVPQKSLHDIEIISELLTDNGLFFSSENLSHGESFCRWVRICEASGLRFLPINSTGYTFTRASGERKNAIGVFTKNKVGAPPARREDIIAAHVRDSFDSQRIDGHDSIVDVMFSSFEKKDLYVCKARFRNGVTIVSRVGVAGALGYYHVARDDAFCLLHYDFSVNLHKILGEVKEARRGFIKNGARVSWDTYHPDICLSLGLEFDEI